LVMCLCKHHARKAYFWVEIYVSCIHSHCTRWRWAVSLIPRLLSVAERDPYTHWVVVRVGTRASPDAVWMREISCPYQKLNNDVLVL
jgi:hypothetical protein